MPTIPSLLSSQFALLFLLTISQLIPLNDAFFADSLDSVRSGALFGRRTRRQTPGNGDKSEGAVCNMHSECLPGLACKMSGKAFFEYFEPRKCKPLNS
ncbi:hypothetical protein niasHS_010593 [Heterodera schachtii]|uniref:Uncharacterized protein n=1 Tax=Heterodera schachtii TaxID=97005 RepID=A0ABD2ITY9_HETSC